jgi:hypothetical protein
MIEKKKIQMSKSRNTSPVSVSNSVTVSHSICMLSVKYPQAQAISGQPEKMNQAPVIRTKNNE